MSKIAEKKAKEIAKKLEASQAYNFDNFSVVCGAIEGYNQAIQDFLKKAEKILTKKMYFSDEEANLFKNYMQNEMQRL